MLPDSVAPDVRDDEQLRVRLRLRQHPVLRLGRTTGRGGVQQQFYEHRVVSVESVVLQLDLLVVQFQHLQQLLFFVKQQFHQLHVAILVQSEQRELPVEVLQLHVGYRVVLDAERDGVEPVIHTIVAF